MYNPKVSIIIPVYNVEQYIKECLESIIHQSFADFEVVLVDDGSTDLSGNICEEYSQKDQRFQVIHKENGGASSARNVGLNHAKGEWLLFWDSDDYADVDFIANMIEVIGNDDVDIVSCDYYIFRNGNDEYKNNAPNYISPKFFICAALANKIHAGLWCKMFRKSLFDAHNIRFPNYSYYEDMYVFLTILQYTNRIAVLHKASYHYRFNEDSLTNDKSFEKRLKLFNEFKENMDELNRRYSIFSDEDILKAFYVSVNYNKLKIITQYPDKKALLKPVSNYRRESYSLSDVKSFRSLLFFLVLRYNMFWLIRLRNTVRDIVYGKNV